MKKRKYILTLIIFHIVSIAVSQTITKSSIDSGGGSVINGSIQLLYTIGEVNVLESSTGTISISEGFINGVALNTDDDNDGVKNDLDLCPDTPTGEIVNANGCILLDSDNFNIEVISETCPNKNNGQIIITATSTYDYVATINGVDYIFNSNLIVDDFSPGTYDMCIAVPGVIVKQCYTVSIVEGITISGKSSTTKNKVTVEILEGTAPFDVLVNGKEVLRTMSSTFDIGVQHGDLIEVKTDVSCEGVFSKKIQLFEVITLYPNPTGGLFEVAIPLNLKEVDIEIYNYNSQLILKNTYPVNYGKVQLDLTNNSAGVYYVKVLAENQVTLKIIKK